jgi:hypothetical protein
MPSKKSAITAPKKRIAPGITKKIGAESSSSGQPKRTDPVASALEGNKLNRTADRASTKAHRERVLKSKGATKGKIEKCAK